MSTMTEAKVDQVDIESMTARHDGVTVGIDWFDVDSSGLVTEMQLGDGTHLDVWPADADRFVDAR